MDNYWNKKTFCLVTGASRGIGRSIAIEFAKKVGPGSLLLLLARSQSGLEETKKEILENPENHSKNIVLSTVDLAVVDFQNYKSVIESSLKQCKVTTGDFDHVMIVQNAASLGIQSGLKIADMGELPQLEEYYSFNIFGFMLLNTAFFQVFNETNASKQLRSAIHISSLGAVQPFKTWGLYCAAKAARDMLMKSMALESGIHTLNWAPGSVNTAIYDEAVKFTKDPDLAKAFEDDRKEGKVLTCEQTVTKLMRVLAEQKYTQGEHVSYNDID